MRLQQGNYFLYTTSFVTGFITLSLEMLGFRMLAPYFGYSIYISGSLIGIILVALTVGYYLGGLLADKKPMIDIMFKLILVADVYIFGIAMAYNPILAYFSKLSLIAGAALATAVLFAIPMILLSIVSPYLVKVLSSKSTIGKVSGKISALSTLGSIAGVFVTTFLFIPWLGTHRTLYVIAISLLLIIVYWLAKKNAKYFLALVLLLLISPAQQLESPLGKVVYAAESEYNLVRVIERDDELAMVLNSDNWKQSVFKKSNVLSDEYYDFFSVAALLTGRKKALLLGMGSGTSVVQLRTFFPEMRIDAVEIDPKVVETAYQFFDVPREDEKIRIFTEDARSFLKRSKEKYDFIELDVYNGDAYVPFYVITEEFFREVKEHLTDEGILVMNVILVEESAKKKNVMLPIANTIVSVFPSTFAILIPYNAIIIATNKQTAREEVVQMFKKNTIVELSKVVLWATSVFLEEIKPRADITVLRDDLAPIERLTYEMYQGIV